MKLVTMKRLNSALDDVRRELDSLDLWTERVAGVEVYLVPAGFAYGWKWDGRHGSIDIPALSTSRLAERLFGTGHYISLRQVIRHEYGHAIADLYRKLTRNAGFGRAFGGSYDNHRIAHGDHPCEIYADTFADFLRREGSRPAGLKCPVARQQWRFVDSMIKAIRRNP